MAAIAAKTPKNFHDSIRSMWNQTSNVATSTTSAAAVYEKQATNTTDLLEEQRAANKEIIKLLTQQVKMLKHGGAGGGGGGGFYLRDYLDIAKWGKKGLSKLGRGLKVVIAGGIAGIAGAYKLGFSGITKQATAFIASSFKGVGKHIITPIKGLLNIFTSSGIWKNLGSSLSKILPKIGTGTLLKGIGGKILGPYSMAIMGVFDSLSGMWNAKDILGKAKVSFMDRIVTGWGSMINGFLFGAPDVFAQKYGFKNLSSAFVAAKDTFSATSLFLLKKIPGVNALIEASERKGGVKALVFDTFDKIRTSVWDAVTSLGSSISNWFSNTAKDIRTNFQGWLTGGNSSLSNAAKASNASQAGAAIGAMVTPSSTSSSATGGSSLVETGVGGSLWTPEVSPTVSSLNTETVTGGSKAATVMNALMEEGLSKRDAAAIAGNAYVESAGFNDKVIQGNRKGDGGKAAYLAQWHPDRQEKLKRYAKEKGLPLEDIRTQAKFMVEESTKGSPYADSIAVRGMEWMKANPNASVEDATKVFMDHFERPNANPNVNHIGRRQAAAKGFMDMPTTSQTVITSKDHSGTAGNGDWEGVDPRLKHLYEETSKVFPLRNRMMSGKKGRGKGNHAEGNAFDITLYDQAGNPLPSYQEGTAFRAYELFAQTMHKKAQELYPELVSGKNGEMLDWGGLFGGNGKGGFKYGSADLMDFRINRGDKTRAGNIMTGLQGDYKGWYDKNDVLGGSKPYSEEAYSSDMLKLQNFVLSDEQKNRASYFGVARNSPRLGPNKVTPTTADLGQVAKAKAVNFDMPSASKVKQATPMFDQALNASAMAKPSVPSYDSLMQPTQRQENPVTGASGGREAEGFKVSDVPSMDELKMMLINGSAIT